MRFISMSVVSHREPFIYTRTPSMTSFFVLGGSFPFNLLEDELVADDVDGTEIEDSCILGEDIVDIEGVGLSS